MSENITKLPIPSSIVIIDIESPSEIFYERICLNVNRRCSGLKTMGPLKTVESFRSDSLLCEKLDNLGDELESNNSVQE
jgi:hypothetical protein